MGPAHAAAQKLIQKTRTHFHNFPQFNWFFIFGLPLKKITFCLFGETKIPGPMVISIRGCPFFILGI